MKNLLVFLLLAAAVGLVFHDRQQSNDLKSAQDENDRLTSQLAEQKSAFDLQAQKYQQLIQQLRAQAAQIAPPAGNAPQPQAPFSGFGGPNPLDQPASRGHQGH